MIKKVLEYDIKGFHLILDEKNGGWNCVIGNQEIKFPNLQAAKAAITTILKDADSAIKSEGGIVVRKVPEQNITKSVAIEKPY